LEEKEIQQIEEPDYKYIPMVLVLSNGTNVIGHIDEDDFMAFMDEKINLLTVFDPYMFHLELATDIQYNLFGKKIFPCFHPLVEMSDDECYVLHRQHILTTAFPNDELLDSYVAKMQQLDDESKKEIEEAEKKKKEQDELLKIINEPDDNLTVPIDRKHRKTIH